MTESLPVIVKQNSWWRRKPLTGRNAHKIIITGRNDGEIEPMDEIEVQLTIDKIRNH